MATTPDIPTVGEALDRLRIMAQQRKSSEMDKQEREDDDFQRAYDWFCDEARAILAALSDRHAGEGWQPIETAPRDGARVDLWIVRLSSSGRHHDEHRVPNCYWDARKDRWRTSWLRADGHPPIPANYVPTHWMPLPAPPSSTETGEQAG